MGTAFANAGATGTARDAASRRDRLSGEPQREGCHIHARAYPSPSAERSLIVIQHQGPVRRQRRADRRAQVWTAQIDAAPDGKSKFEAAVSWTRSELSKLAEIRPDDGDAAYAHIAGQLAAIARQLPRRTAKGAS